MRSFFKSQGVGLDHRFHYRGMSQTRVETFSDAAFALAITLLVLSSSVPGTFEELRTSMRMIIPFGISVVLITVIWYQHYLFFLKFGLQDAKTIALNAVLIFLILVYVYPLKFLTRFLFEAVIALFTKDFNIISSGFGEFTHSNMRFLMMIYGFGAAFIFFVLSLMYRYALSQKKALELTDYEIFMTRSSMLANFLLGAIPALSACISLFSFGNSPFWFTVAGFSYFLYPPVMFAYGYRHKQKANALFGNAE